MDIGDYSKKTKDEYQAIVLQYFKYRNVYNMGYIKYVNIKNLIRFVTNIENQNTIRYIFQSLLNKKIFERKVIYNQIYYRFNPYNKRENLEKIIIHFN